MRLPEGIALDALPVALLHRLYLAIYRELYDGPVQNAARCIACREPFEFELDLEAVTAAQDAEADCAGASADGWWRLPGGGEIRAPHSADLHGGLSGLLAAITRGEVPEAEASAFLERAAPLLDFEVETACPHCAETQDLRFSMPRYLVRKLAGERPFLIREVHLLASAYRWPHGEIMALTRGDRRAFAGLIQAERHQRLGIRAIS